MDKVSPRLPSKPYTYTTKKQTSRADKKNFAQIQLTFVIHNNNNNIRNKILKIKFTGLLYKQNEGFIAQGLPSPKGIQLF